MTRLELAEYLGWSAEKVGTTIASTRWLLPEQVFRVVRYAPVTGRRARDLAVYAAEAGTDEPKKRIDLVKRRKQTEARYRQKHRAVISARNQASNATKRGINPWANLAQPKMRAHMAAITTS